ncbi:hypothetical protein ACIHFE_31610 [Streptomyces sp. NPDC052396]|uniref:hypothetical protein n=1 Tax=Streptomyces sp. NPDC052396 TaxID=3365689 RepID=UPI0037CFF898
MKSLAVALPVILPAANGIPGPTAHPAGDIEAARTPSTVTTTRFTPDGPIFADVVRLPTVTGPRKVIVLRMRAASLSDCQLRADGRGGQLALATRELRLRGDVRIYLTRFSGCVQDLVCLTFSPDNLRVPPFVPPLVFMTHVTAEQSLVTSDTTGVDGLRLGIARASAAEGSRQDRYPSGPAPQRS